ncbi:hypothetical protein WKT02_07820 [Erysipelotrichaceae bacterium HCN-30851]
MKMNIKEYYIFYGGYMKLLVLSIVYVIVVFIRHLPAILWEFTKLIETLLKHHRK